jgi:ATP-dependent protease HslVU (ClpYQ) peptidase subunit
MTTILGVQHRNGFTLAADTQTTNGDRPYIHSDMKKITVSNNIWIAGAGVGRVCDVVQYCWTPPTYYGNSEYEFMISKVIPSMRIVIERNGVTLKDDDSFQFLFGVNGKLFEVSDNYTVLTNTNKFYGIGSGANYGIGALMAGATIRKAIEISAELDVYTGGKIQIIKQRSEYA